MAYGESNVTCHVTLNGQGCLTYLLSIRGIKVTTTVVYNKALRTLLYHHV